MARKGELVLSLDAKNLIVLCGLFVISGFLLFYLGMSYGKAIRQISDEQVIVRTLEKDPQQETKDRSVIFDATNTGESAEDYDKKFKDILKKLNNEQTTATDSPANPGDGESSQQPATSITDLPSASAKVTDTEKSNTGSSSTQTGSYTIQVLATNSYDKANSISTQLRKKSYEAYIQTTPSENGDIFRVRVGRFTKPDAEKIINKLKAEISGLGEPKIYPVN